MDDMTLAEMREWAVAELARLKVVEDRIRRELEQNAGNRRMVEAMLRMIDEPRTEQVR